MRTKYNTIYGWRCQWWNPFFFVCETKTLTKAPKSKLKGLGKVLGKREIREFFKTSLLTRNRYSLQLLEFFPERSFQHLEWKHDPGRARAAQRPVFPGGYAIARSALMDPKRDQTDGSLVKGTGCYCKRPRFLSKRHIVAHNC